MKKPLLLCLGLAAASFLAGCASAEKTPPTDKPAESKSEYVRETPTGSWISKKTKKKQTSETQTAEAQRALGDLQRVANDPPKDPETGRRNSTGTGRN